MLGWCQFHTFAGLRSRGWRGCHAWGGGAVLGVVPVPRGCGGMGAGGNSVFSVSRMQIADCGSCQGWGVGVEAWAVSWLSCLGVADARWG